MRDRITFATSLRTDKNFASAFPSPEQWDSGFNGFPFPIQKGKPWDGVTYYKGDHSYQTIFWPSNSNAKWIAVYGPGTAYPLGFTRQQLNKLYWRYRFLKVSVGIYQSFIDSFGTPTIISIDVVYTVGAQAQYIQGFDGGGEPPPNISFTLYVSPVRERVLCLNTEFQWQGYIQIFLAQYASNRPANYTFSSPENGMIASWASSDSRKDDAPDFFDSSVRSNLQLFDQRSFDESGYNNMPVPVLIGDDGLYYPSLEFNGIVGSSIRSSTISPHQLASVLNFMGRNVPLFASNFLIESNYNPYARTDAAPSKFWPYKNTSGDPVYNELTGEQLTDPAA